MSDARVVVKQAVAVETAGQGDARVGAAPAEPGRCRRVPTPHPHPHPQRRPTPRMSKRASVPQGRARMPVGSASVVACRGPVPVAVRFWKTTYM